MRALLAALVLALLGAGPAHAQSADAEISAAIKDAESLLASLEFQKARDRLEAALADKRSRETRRPTRAKLLLTLGRARAELGDQAGMDEAFVAAVELDPSIALPRGTSPKIVAALERARESAPVAAPRGPKTPPSPKPEPPKPEPPPKPARTATVARPTRSSTGAVSRGGEGGAALVVRVVGQVRERARVRIVVDAAGLPKTARIEARIRSGDRKVFEPVLMPFAAGTSTQAALSLSLDEPRYEIYVEARVGKKLLARAGSASEPIVLEPAPMPTLAEAWAAPDGAVHTATTSSSTTAATIALAPAEEGAWETSDALILGGAVLGAALIVVVIVLAASGGSSSCDAKEGFGCADVSVRPLLWF